MNDNTKLQEFNFSEVYIPTNKEVNSLNKDYVNWGEKNDYPTYLLYLYNNSDVHQTIVDNTSRYIYGQGLVSDNVDLNTFINKENQNYNTVNDEIKNIIRDYVIFGGFSLQPIFSRTRKLIELNYIDITKIRTNEDHSKLYYSDKWKNYNVEYKEYQNYYSKYYKDIIFYYNNTNRNIYPQPEYQGALKSILTSIEIQNFHLHSILNNFTATSIIEVYGEKTNEELQYFKRKVNEEYTGSNNAAKMLIMQYNDPSQKTNVIKLESDNIDDKFTNLRKDVRDSIFTAHRITSPALLGVKIENQGFSKTEYMEAFDIYNNTVILSSQNEIIYQLKKILKNDFDVSTLRFEPYKINITTV